MSEVELREALAYVVNRCLAWGREGEPGAIIVALRLQKSLKFSDDELRVALATSAPGDSPKWTAVADGLPQGFEDMRKLVWLVDKDGMGWIGIRFWRGDEGYWTVNGDREESANVTHWMNLPERP